MSLLQFEDSNTHITQGHKELGTHRIRGVKAPGNIRDLGKHEHKDTHDLEAYRSYTYTGPRDTQELKTLVFCMEREKLHMNMKVTSKLVRVFFSAFLSLCLCLSVSLCHCLPLLLFCPVSHSFAQTMAMAMNLDLLQVVPSLISPMKWIL